LNTIEEDGKNALKTAIQDFNYDLNHKDDIVKQYKATFKLTRIEPDELTDPPGGKEIRKNCIVKKFLKKNKNVACIPVTVQDYDKSRLIVLEELRGSRNVLKFYGISDIDKHSRYLNWLNVKIFAIFIIHARSIGLQR